MYPSPCSLAAEANTQICHPPCAVHNMQHLHESDQSDDTAADTADQQSGSIGSLDHSEMYSDEPPNSQSLAWGAAHIEHRPAGKPYSSPADIELSQPGLQWTPAQPLSHTAFIDTAIQCDLTGNPLLLPLSSIPEPPGLSRPPSFAPSASTLVQQSWLNQYVVAAEGGMGGLEYPQAPVSVPPSGWAESAGSQDQTGQELGPPPAAADHRQPQAPLIAASLDLPPSASEAQSKHWTPADLAAVVSSDAREASSQDTPARPASGSTRGISWPPVTTARLDGMSYHSKTAFTSLNVNGSDVQSTSGFAWGTRRMKYPTKRVTVGADVTLSCVGYRCARQDPSGSPCFGQVSLAESVRRVNMRRVDHFTSLCANHLKGQEGDLLNGEDYDFVVHCTQCVLRSNVPYMRGHLRKFKNKTMSWSRCVDHPGGKLNRTAELRQAGNSQGPNNIQ